MNGKRVLSIVERYDNALNGLESEAIARIEAALDASYRNLERRIIQSYNQQSNNLSLLPRQRMLLIIDDVRSLLGLISNESDIIASYEQLLSGGYTQGYSLSEELVRAIANEQLEPFSSVPLDAVAAQARDGLSRLKNHTQSFANNASALIEMGLIQGWGSKKVAINLRKQLGVTKTKAETIARTETMSAYNTAVKARYSRANIEHVQWMATPSDALCVYCAARNMRVYKLNEIVIPAHPRCRCVFVAWRKSWPMDEAFAVEYRDRLLSELKASGRSPNYGLTPFERAGQLEKPPQHIWTPRAA